MRSTMDNKMDMRGIKVKKYVKPELFYEHYELSQHIADCTWEWENLTDENVCFASMNDPGMPQFKDYKVFLSYDTCALPRDMAEQFCYQNSSANASLFKS